MERRRRAATLPVAFFRQDAEAVARGLLGTILVSEVRGARVAGRIVETEAYLGATDPASHAWNYRRHPANEALYGRPGDWYVYLSYGIHWCANLVTGPRGSGSAVLLRALEPIEGIPRMRRRRGGVDTGELCAGPGRLCQAMGITRTLSGQAMRASAARILVGEQAPDVAIVATPRIGITKAAEWALRFTIRDSRWVSRPRP